MCASLTRRLGKQLRHGFGFDQLAGLVEVVIDDGVGVDADGVVDGGDDVDGVSGILQRGGAGGVGLAVDVAAFDAGTGEDSGVAIRPVVAAVVAVAVATGADAALRAAAEFAEGDDERFVEEATFVEIRDEGGKAAIEHGGGLVFHAAGEADVDIPGVVVAVGDFRPDHFDDARAGFDQAAGEEAALAERVAAVAVANFVGLIAERERFAGLAGRDEAEGRVVVFVEVVLGDGLVDFGHALVDHVAEAGAAIEPRFAHFGPQREVIDLDAVELVHVHVVARGEQVVRVVRAAEKAGGARLVDDIALLQRPRQHDERQHRRRRRLEADDVAAKVRKVFRRRRLKLAGGADFVGRVAGVNLIDRGGVVEEADRRVAHRADERELVGDLIDLGEQFGHVHAGRLGRDALENAADVVGHIVFGIPQVEVARSALQINQDHAFRAAPAGSFALDDGRGGLGRLHLEHAAERHAEDAGAADAEDVAAGDAEVRVADIFAGLARDAEHRHGGILWGGELCSWGGGDSEEAVVRSATHSHPSEYSGGDWA